jgi:hypothetical protein
VRSASCALLFTVVELEDRFMPEKRTLERAERDRRQGKAPTTQAGEFIREEMDHIRQGRHGARSSRQAIAIGLSKARRAGVELPPPKKGSASAKTRKSAARDIARAHGSPRRRKVTVRRKRASADALKRESTSPASHGALAKQARSAARRRSAGARSAAARKAARTKGPAARHAAARRAARTRGAEGAAHA